MSQICVFHLFSYLINIKSYFLNYVYIRYYEINIIVPVEVESSPILLSLFLPISLNSIARDALPKAHQKNHLHEI